MLCFNMFEDRRVLEGRKPIVFGDQCVHPKHTPQVTARQSLIYGPSSRLTASSSSRVANGLVT